MFFYSKNRVFNLIFIILLIPFFGIFWATSISHQTNVAERNIRAQGESPIIFKTNYTYDSTTQTGTLSAYYYPGADQYGNILNPLHLGITSNSEVPEYLSSWTNVYDEGGGISDEYSPDNWLITRKYELIIENPTTVYYTEIDLEGIDSSFAWEDYYVILNTNEDGGILYSYYDVVPMSYSAIIAPEEGETIITDITEDSVTMKSTMYPGITFGDFPWTIQPDSIEFYDYAKSDVEILSSEYEGSSFDSYVIEFKITDLSPLTLYDESTLMVTFVDSLYTNASKTVVQTIPGFITNGAIIEPPLPPLVPEEQTPLLLIGMVYLLVLTLVIIFVILLIVYISKRRKRKRRNIQ